MDQAAPAHQSFIRDQRECGEAQIWIAVSVYVLVAIVRKRLRLEASLYQTLQILSVMLFEKTPILSALQGIDMDADFTENINQLFSSIFNRTAVNGHIEAWDEPSGSLTLSKGQSLPEHIGAFIQT